jgi:hypothetical protein
VARSRIMAALRHVAHSRSELRLSQWCKKSNKDCAEP